MIAAQQIPPELVEQIMYVVMAAVGWFAKWLASKKKVKELESTNEKLKEVVIQYDQAARDALRTARKPRPRETPGTEGEKVW